MVPKMYLKGQRREWVEKIKEVKQIIFCSANFVEKCVFQQTLKIILKKQYLFNIIPYNIMVKD